MLTFEHHPERREYRAVMEATPAAHISYDREGAVVTLRHTETSPEFQGKGIAGQLMHFVMDDVRAAGLRVVPQCSYAAAWLDRHPEFADLRS